MHQLPLFLVLALSAWNDSPMKAQPTSEVSRLIQQLASGSSTEREAASKVLETIGEPALEALKKAIETSGDAEFRRRAKQVVESVQARLYRKQPVFKGHRDYIYRVVFRPKS